MDQSIVMRKSKFTEAQILFALKQAETGVSIDEICRKLGISEATFYNWKKKFSGLGVSELRKLRQLEEENQNFDEENTDLRQLTVDGYTMAQNAQKLEAEREQLSVDLADKAKTIKQLLQENEQLKFDL